ncbi:MAG: GAF domain-containing protein [Bdellovibrionales bacterium]|nr:GAF domain-containing protein [Bdellovibrionales bacterium]
MELSSERLTFLAELPTLLNSSLKTGQVIEAALKYLRSQLQAEAATVFLTQAGSGELLFWALQGSGASGLAGKRMPSDKGLVGWVIQHREALLVNDVQNDPRFFSEIDRESEFRTRSVICVPLVARGKKLIGALQVLNRLDDQGFSPEDLYFVERFGHQAALAIFNAKLYKEAQSKNRQLAELNRKKDDMMSVIIHEFRTPINILQNSIELLTDEAIAGAARETVARTLKNGLTRLTTTVARIRDVTAVTGGTLQLHREPVLVTDVVELLNQQFGPIFADRKQEYTVTIGADVSAVSADHTLILVALKNLISNAIRFTPDGGSIALAIFRTAGLVEFAVTDTGIGIEPDQQEAIFETFYEAVDALEHSSGTYEFKSCGLGLGLPTARAILEGHGTEITVRSKPGLGSRFSFRLPVA